MLFEVKGSCTYLITLFHFLQMATAIMMCDTVLMRDAEQRYLQRLCIGSMPTLLQNQHFQHSIPKGLIESISDSSYTQYLITHPTNRWYCSYNIKRYADKNDEAYINCAVRSHIRV